MMISTSNTISSLSPGWIESVKRSGRFSAYRWDTKERVQVVTLDQLIAVFGTPSFCKIDVEGYEHEVLRGLSRPLAMLSFEFTPEYCDAAVRCIEHLQSLGGEPKLNLSLGEDMSFQSTEWVEPERMVTTIRAITGKDVFGDVYVRTTL